MKNMIEGYVIIIAIWLMVLLSISFTGINLNVTAAKKIHNNVISEIQNTDGAILKSNKFVYDHITGIYTMKQTAENNAYVYTITVEKEDIGSEITDNGQTFIYNSIYKVNMTYEYYIPLFGKETYVTGRYAK